MKLVQRHTYFIHSYGIAAFKYLCQELHHEQYLATRYDSWIINLVLLRYAAIDYL
jgi:hypothetical protein